MRLLKLVMALGLLVLVILTFKEILQVPPGLAGREHLELDQTREVESGSPKDVVTSSSSDAENSTMPLETSAPKAHDSVEADLATVLDVRSGSIEGYLERVTGQQGNLDTARMEKFKETELLWKELCRQAAAAVRKAEAERGMDLDRSSNAPLLDAGKFCAGHDMLMDDLADVEEAFLAGATEIRDPYPQLEDVDEDRAADFLANELDRALQQGSLSRTLGLLGQLHARNLISIRDRNGDTVLPPIASEVKVTEALAAYLLCQRIGGCGASNALVLRLCYGLELWECTTPRDLYDALEQLLSGQERFLFEDRRAQVERILVRAR